MANYFIIGGDGKEYGPVPVEELRQWIAENRVGPQTRVRSENASDWRPLADVPELAALPKKPAPHPAPIAAPVSDSKTSAMAISSLVLGILGMFTCGATALFGLILGIIAIVKINNSRGALRGHGMAIGGTVVSGIFLLMIPIFAAMLLPALASAQDRARQIICMNNEKQLALAVIVFSSDHTNRFPSATNWCDAINPAAGNQKIFLCPGANSQSGSDYAFNAKLSDLEQSKVNPQTVMIFEANGGWNAHGGPELLAAPRHGRIKGVNVAFADGHVETVSPARLNTLRWDP